MKPFGRTRKQMAFVILAIGLLTFTVPLVSTTPPVMGRAQWSAWNIAAQVYARKLPVPDGRFDEALVEIALIYLLMVFALVALCFPRSEKPVRVLAGIGFAISSLAKFWRFASCRHFTDTSDIPGTGMSGLARLGSCCLSSCRLFFLFHSGRRWTRDCVKRKATLVTKGWPGTLPLHFVAGETLPISDWR